MAPRRGSSGTSTYGGNTTLSDSSWVLDPYVLVHLIAVCISMLAILFCLYNTPWYHRWTLSLPQARRKGLKIFCTALLAMLIALALDLADLVLIGISPDETNTWYIIAIFYGIAYTIATTLSIVLISRLIEHRLSQTNKGRSSFSAVIKWTILLLIALAVADFAAYIALIVRRMQYTDDDFDQPYAPSVYDKYGAYLNWTFSIIDLTYSTALLAVVFGMAVVHCAITSLDSSRDKSRGVTFTALVTTAGVAALNLAYDSIKILHYSHVYLTSGTEVFLTVAGPIFVLLQASAFVCILVAARSATDTSAPKPPVTQTSVAGPPP